MNIQSMYAIALGLILSFNVAAETNKSVIEPFYGFLSNPSSDKHADAFIGSVTDNWKSIGDYSGASKNQDNFVKQVKGFGKLIPDLNWSIQEVVSNGNKIVVRSRATGTPKGPLFGVDGKGKPFDILTIDLHTIKNGKVVETYHVEDWSGALRQLRSQ